MDEQLVADVRETKRTIQTRGWTSGSYERWSGGPVCGVGAARIATTGNAHEENERTVNVLRAVERQLRQRRWNGATLLSFNDEQATAGPVLRLLDTVIRAEAPFVWPAMPQPWSAEQMRIDAAALGERAAEILVEPIAETPLVEHEQEAELVGAAR